MFLRYLRHTQKWPPYRVSSVAACKMLTECSRFSPKSALAGKIPKALCRQRKRRNPQQNQGIPAFRKAQRSTQTAPKDTCFQRLKFKYFCCKSDNNFVSSLVTQIRSVCHLFDLIEIQVWRIQIPASDQRPTLAPSAKAYAHPSWSLKRSKNVRVRFSCRQKTRVYYSNGKE